MSRVAVLGGTGAMGTTLCGVLRARGHDVVAASRANGVDATTGAGLDDALAGADSVAALREGLLPRGEVKVDERRFAEWLSET